MRYVSLRAHLPESAIVHVPRALVESDRVHEAHLVYGGIADEDPAYLFYVEGDAEPVEAALAADGVEDYELTRVDEDHLYVHLTAERTNVEEGIQAAFERGTLVTTLPLVFEEDGGVSFDVIGTTDEVRDAIDALPVEVTIERVGEYRGLGSGRRDGLTDRQREVVETAIDLGYYEQPRQATHEDVASELDIAPSTVSDHLRRAESRLVQSAFDA